MARKKKGGRRATGVQSKKGMLYIVITQCVIRNGTRAYERKWISTGLQDTAENIRKAQGMRARLLQQDPGARINRDITVADYVDMYLEKKKRTISDSTYSSYVYRGSHIRKYFGSCRLKAITVLDVECFLDHLFTDENAQPRTVKDIKVFFGSIMEQAVQDDLINTNPVKGASINKALAAQHTKPKDDGNDFFSFKEAQMFLKAVEEHELYELFFVTLFFGLRREEVLGLRWSCINLKKKEFCINHTVTKGTQINRLNTTKTRSSVRVYPLNDLQVSMFEHLRHKEIENKRLFGNRYHDNDYVFKHQDGSLYYPDYPSKAFKKVIKAHPDLPQDITFHGLRSSCVSILIHEGFDVKRIQKWVGHADINTTLKIYAKAKDKESKQEILNGMDEIIKPKNYENQ